MKQKSVRIVVAVEERDSDGLRNLISLGFLAGLAVSSGRKNRSVTYQDYANTPPLVNPQHVSASIESQPTNRGNEIPPIEQYDYRTDSYRRPAKSTAVVVEDLSPAVIQSLSGKKSPNSLVMSRENQPKPGISPLTVGFLTAKIVPMDRRQKIMAIIVAISLLIMLIIWIVSRRMEERDRPSFGCVVTDTSSGNSSSLVYVDLGNGIGTTEQNIDQPMESPDGPIPITDNMRPDSPIPIPDYSPSPFESDCPFGSFLTGDFRCACSCSSSDCSSCDPSSTSGSYCPQDEEDPNSPTNPTSSRQFNYESAIPAPENDRLPMSERPATLDVIPDYRKYCRLPKSEQPPVTLTNNNKGCNHPTVTPLHRLGRRKSDFVKGNSVAEKIDFYENVTF